MGLFSTHDAYDMVVAVIGNHLHPKGKVSFGGRDEIQKEAKELNPKGSAFTCWEFCSVQPCNMRPLLPVITGKM